MVRLFAVIAAVVSIGLHGPVRAQEPPAEPPAPRGHLTAFACEALPGPVSVQVQVMDNADRNVQLRDIFIQEMRKNGAQVMDTASQVISLEFDVARQATVRKPGDMVDVRVGGDDRESGMNDYARVHMNVWSTSRDSLLTGRQDRIEEEGYDLLRMRASLNSKQDGRCLWQGEIVHRLDGDDPFREASRLLPLLADAVGKPANRIPIREP